MNILQIISSKNVGGGSQEHTRLLSCGLKSKGHAVTMICRHGSLVDAYRREALETIPVELRDRVKAARFLVRLIKERKFDVVHTHNRDGDIAGLIAGRTASVSAVVSTVHAYINRDKFGNRKMNVPLWFYNKILKFLPHRIIVLSQGLKKHILEELKVNPEKISCIMNSVDLTKLKFSKESEEIKKELNISANTKIIGCVGKMIFLKGYQYLVDSAKEILQQFPDVKFILVGDGNQRKVLEQKVKEYGIQKNFIFLGEREDTIKILKAFDIFVHPSLSEGLPRVVMEAQGLKIPVIATSIGGTPEVVKDGKTGILIPPKNSTALSKAMISLLKDDKKREQMGEIGRETIEEKFSHIRMINETESLFLQLLNR
jgi:glycosyltransferase involved in cell wall biosynthesis